MRSHESLRSSTMIIAGHHGEKTVMMMMIFWGKDYPFSCPLQRDHRKTSFCFQLPLYPRFVVTFMDGHQISPFDRRKTIHRHDLSWILFSFFPFRSFPLSGVSCDGVGESLRWWCWWLLFSSCGSIWLSQSTHEYSNCQSVLLFSTKRDYLSGKKPAGAVEEEEEEEEDGDQVTQVCDQHE